MRNYETEKFSANLHANCMGNVQNSQQQNYLENSHVKETLPTYSSVLVICNYLLFKYAPSSTVRFSLTKYDVKKKINFRYRLISIKIIQVLCCLGSKTSLRA